MTSQHTTPHHATPHHATAHHTTPATSDPLIHGDTSGNHTSGHGSDHGVEAGTQHPGAAMKDADQVVHIVLIAHKQRGVHMEALLQSLTGAPVELFHSHQNRKDVVFLCEGIDPIGDGVEICVVFIIGLLAFMMKVNAFVVAALVLPRQLHGCRFHQVGLDGPPEGVDGAQCENRCLSIPSLFFEKGMTPFGRGGIECPCRIRTRGGSNSHGFEDISGGFVSADDQGVRHMAFDETFQVRIHVTGFCTITNGELAFDGGHAESPGHHGGQCIGKF